MAAIPGWVYLILGIIMILASQLIKDADGSKPMLIFLYVGIIFIIIGIGKYIFNAVFRKEDKSMQKHKLEQGYINTEQRGNQHVVHPNQQQPRRQSHQQYNHQPIQQHQQDSQLRHSAPNPSNTPNARGYHEVHKAQHPKHMSIVACPLCGTKHYSYASYCMRCGARIKK